MSYDPLVIPAIHKRRLSPALGSTIRKLQRLARIEANLRDAPKSRPRPSRVKPIGRGTRNRYEPTAGASGKTYQNGGAREAARRQMRRSSHVG